MLLPKIIPIPSQPRPKPKRRCWLPLPLPLLVLGIGTCNTQLVGWQWACMHTFYMGQT